MTVRLCKKRISYNIHSGNYNGTMAPNYNHTMVSSYSDNMVPKYNDITVVVSQWELQ